MAEINRQLPALNLDQLGAREILDSLADGAYITDADRNIIFWSRNAEQITGWSAADVVGRSCRDNLLVHVDKDGHQLCGKEYCPLHRAMVTGTRSRSPILVFAQRKDGKRVPVEVSVAPLRAAGGEVIGGIEVFRDMTGMMDDLWRAKTIQTHALESLVPPDARVAFDVCYVPQEIVGGDFYHIEQLGPDRYGVMVADFMGHGVAAALYCMQLRSFWEDLHDELMQPARFVGLVNQRIHKLALADGYFATAAYVLLDLAAGSLTVVRAGHPAPVLLRHDGQRQRIEPPGAALGLFDATAYDELTVPFGVGDTLLLYTDGAAEIANRADNELGDEGLLNLLCEGTAAGVVPPLEQVEEKLLHFSNLLRLADDLTLLTVRRRA